MANRPNVYRPRPQLTVSQRERESGRASADERGYGSDWRKVRKAAIARDKALCINCEKQDVLKEFDLVDHIVPICIEPSLRLALDNLQCLCHSCHKAKTLEDMAKYGAAYKPL